MWPFFPFSFCWGLHIIIVIEAPDAEVHCTCGPEGALFLPIVKEKKYDDTAEKAVKLWRSDQKSPGEAWVNCGGDAEGIQILQRVDYYRLRAYALGLESPDDRERYCSGINLNHIYRLYCFDSLLRGLMWPLLEEIEIELRTNMAYHLAMTYGADGYMDVHNFHDTINKNGKSFMQRRLSSFTQKWNGGAICLVWNATWRNTAGVSLHGRR